MKSLLKLEHVSKIYQMGDLAVRALDDVSLAVEKGEFLAIMGPSGSGKSTLMHIMGLLDRPDQGRIYLRQKLVSKLLENERALIRNEEIGFVFQFFYLLPKVSALENVKLPLLYAGVIGQEQNKRALAALREVNMEKRALHLPSQLSGGERQRVAVARALVNNPAIILADEPTGNLDSHSGEEVLKILSDLNQRGRTVILITHNEKLAHFAHSLIKIGDGKIIGHKKPFKGKI